MVTLSRGVYLPHELRQSPAVFVGGRYGAMLPSVSHQHIGSVIPPGFEHKGGRALGNKQKHNIQQQQQETPPETCGRDGPRVRANSFQFIRAAHRTPSEKNKKERKPGGVVLGPDCVRMKDRWEGRCREAETNSRSVLLACRGRGRGHGRPARAALRKNRQVRLCLRVGRFPRDTTTGGTQPNRPRLPRRPRQGLAPSRDMSDLRMYTLRSNLRVSNAAVSGYLGQACTAMG